jgi:hypothetical protein
LQPRDLRQVEMNIEPFDKAELVHFGEDDAAHWH